MLEKSYNVIAGSLGGNIWRLSWPLMAVMVLNFVVGLVDVYVAGLISPDVQAAVGFMGQLFFLAVIVANAVSVGTLAMVSRAVGSGDEQRALHIARQALIFSFAGAMGITAAGLLLSGEVIALAGVPREIREMAGDLFRIFLFALGPNYILIISNAVFNASGEVRKPLLTMSVVTTVNVAAAFGLVFGYSFFPEMGYKGIAMATALSFLAGMLMNLFFFSTGRWKSFWAGHWKASADTIMRIIDIGWPAAVLQITWNAGTIVLYNILGRLGDGSITALASITNGLRIEAVIYLPAFALNMAASVLIGQNLGTGDADRAERAGWKIARSGVILVSVMALLFFLLAEHLAALLTRDRDVLEGTARYLRFNMLSEPFMALSAILGGALQGAGDTRGTLKVIVVSMWLIRLPLAWLLALTLHYGAAGVWAAMVVSMLIQGILMAARFQRGRWKALKIG